MESNAFYQRETADDYFKQIESAATDTFVDGADLLTLYRRLAKLFNRLINGATAHLTLLLSGTYAKTDYLLKNREANKDMRLMINDARSRFSSLTTLGHQDMSRFAYADVEALTRFTALVFNCDTPQGLRRYFPQTRPKRNPGRLTHEYLRVIVSDFSSRSIFATTSDNPNQMLEIQYASTDGDNDFSYLRPWLSEGVQLNLIRPRRDGEGVLHPELIIYEPDFLINVSSIASCFESYNTDAILNCIKSLQPAPSGDAINLGNFAGQLLDEIIHNEYGKYTDSAMRFFRQNALSLSAEPPAVNFHQEAKSQVENIRRAVDSQMPSEVGSFDRSNLMVEPTFFSEMLGLQGRMDFLQLDLKVLAEQKSGKGEFPYGNFDTPRKREPHYVQLLLYMAIIRYNFAAQYARNNEELHAFLMYSKYTRSLLLVGFAPKLLRQAMEIRNGIVANDLRFSTEGYGFLTTMTADSLNAKNLTTKIWTDYIRPQLHSVFLPIQGASQLERAYFLRFMRFVAREHMLSKIGNKQKEGSGFASTWQDALEEKRDAGNIYTGLKLRFNFPSSGKIECLTLDFTDDESCDMANFRVGDIVILYPYDQGEVPDVRRNMVMRCTVEEISDGYIKLRLRSAQTGSTPFDINRDRLWAIEHDFLESSYSSIYRGMHAFLRATQSRRDLLLLQRRPEVDTSVGLKGDYGYFNELSHRVAAARDLFLIIGPPGTGKTSYGMLNTVKEELLRPDSNIIIMAYTNRAVDEICSKLIESDIEFIRLGNEMSCAEAARPSLLVNKVKNCNKSVELTAEILRHRVFVSTTTALNSCMASLFRLKTFSLGVIDEASQILEPQLLGIMSAKSESGDAIAKFVLIGDHKQLPAIVQQSIEESRVDEDCLREIGLFDCRLSLFERLARRYGSDPSVCYMLTRQGRMHREIAEFISRKFYGGRLCEVPLGHQIAELPGTPADASDLRRLIDLHRMLFIDVEETESSLADKVNRAEARLIAQILQEIYLKEGDAFDPTDTVGVIVPYRNQIAAIRGEVAGLKLPALADISIDTVERYQGSQRKYIIYGFTVKKYYQLEFLTSHVFEDIDGAIIDRKLNVALTRAREHMIMTGNANLLRRNSTFAALLSHIASRGGLFEM